MEHQKMNMGKNKFRIGDLAHELKVKKYVIRFWEKEFDLSSDRSQGGQRFYTQDDLNTFIQIKDLLYIQKFTIAGAKKHLKVGVAIKEVHASEAKNVEIINVVESHEHIMPATVEHLSTSLKDCDATCFCSSKVSDSMQHFLSELKKFKHELEALKEQL